MFRIAFNPALPVVASSSFGAKGRKFASGDPVDWRALGITEQKLLDWWRAGLVSHPISPAPTALPAAPVQPDSSPAEVAAVLEQIDAVLAEDPASGEIKIIPMGAEITPGGEKRTVVIDGKPVQMTAGPTINVATPEQQRRPKRR